MNPSPECLTAVKGWEGCKLEIYPDLNGFATIAWGHKLTHDDVVSGRYANGISQLGADALFLADCTPFEEQIDALKLTLTQGQFDALFSFNFNLGINDLKTMLSHGLGEVPFQLPRWIHAGSKVETGLVKRRAQEVAWWNQG
jgi:lysozyme